MVSGVAEGVRTERRPGPTAAADSDGLPGRSRWPGVVAIVAGGASAVLSLYWMLGGTALLDIVGGDAERLAETGGVRALFVGAVVVAAKAVLVAVAAILASGGASLPVRWIGLGAGGLLAVYGIGLTAAGLLALTGMFGAVADPRALAWHALLWDPWFIVWGVALWLTARHTCSDRR